MRSQHQNIEVLLEDFLIGFGFIHRGFSRSYL